MQRDSYQLSSKGSSWGSVLTALYRVQKFIGIDDLAKLAGQDEATVKSSLEFLIGQGWVEKLPDADQYACVYQARAVMQSLERSEANARP